jgi:hypothetical protein
MKQLINFTKVLAVVFTASNFSFAQTYLHPTTGIQSEYVGSCLVSDCGPFTYRDNGNNNNYSTGINQIYRVFCPDQAGQCLRVTFNSFNVEAGWDFLQVKNGPTQNSPQFTTAPNGATAYGGITGISGTPATPFSYTSTDPSGCLTFRFYSDGSVTRPGWSSTIQCIPCAGGPNGTDNSDCITATPICSGAAITSNSSGPGIVAEGCNGISCPAGGENHTNWYSFTIQSSGTLAFVINPTDPNDDYDFAVYGPNVTCGSLGNPIRCSDSGNTGQTGAVGGQPDNIENVNGNSYVNLMNVTAGDSYFLVVDEWSPNAGSGYNLIWGGTASLDCTFLPVELSSFDAEYMEDLDVVNVHWTTESERDNDYFEVERSADGINFEVIGKVEGAGTTTNETHYMHVDNDPFLGVNYYRLNQFDISGESKYSEVVTVNILDDMYDILTVFPNPTEGLTEVIFNSYSKQDVQLKITSSTGQEIVNMPMTATPGGNRFDLDLSDYADGMYFITIVSKEKVYSERFMKH